MTEPTNQHHRGVTIWLTGLSGAGKSTIATMLATELEGRGKRVEVLDGDAVRENLSKGLGFSKEDRDTNIRRIGYVAELLTRNGVAVISAAISPYRSVRDEVRARIVDFVEVHVDCSIDELSRRDVKGLYARALAGEIKNFTGVSDPYQAPESPEVRVNSETQTVEESVADILAALEARGHIPAGHTPARAHLEHIGHHDSGSTPHGGELKVRLAEPARARELEVEAAGLPSIQLDLWAISDLERGHGASLSLDLWQRLFAALDRHLVLDASRDVALLRQYGLCGEVAPPCCRQCFACLGQPRNHCFLLPGIRQSWHAHEPKTNTECGAFDNGQIGDGYRVFHVHVAHVAGQDPHASRSDQANNHDQDCAGPKCDDDSGADVSRGHGRGIA